MKALLHRAAALLIVSFGFFAGCQPQPTGYTVGGKVSGLSGTLVLSLNGTESLQITKTGSYKFATSLQASSSYNVSITSSPVTQSCVVANGSGVIGSAS